MMNVAMNLMHDQSHFAVAYWIEPIWADAIQYDAFADLSIVWLVDELVEDLDDILRAESLRLMSDLFDPWSFDFDFLDAFAN